MSVQSQTLANRARLAPIAIVIGAILLVAIGVAVLRLVELAPAPAQAPTGITQEHAHDDPILYGYGWVDKNAGIAHIPIQRAMDLVLQKGLPTRPTPVPTPQDNGQAVPSYQSSGTQTEQVLH
jgi:hypothetical protein